MGFLETTFTSFAPEQAATYASDRGRAYPEGMYARILQYHQGPRDVLLDVGTGPGKVVFESLGHFQKGLGCDAGPEMIEQAKKDAVRHGVADRTGFVVAGGETCSDAFPGVKVDVITVANAAHWFELSRFYSSAAKALRPGGTLAIWTCRSTFVHPSTPNHEKLQQIIRELEEIMLGPFETPGNKIARNAYEKLELPWTLPIANDSFAKSSFERIEWDRHGIPSAPPQADGTPGPFFMEDKASSIHSFLNFAQSSSMLIRWREANPNKAHTAEDPVNITRRRFQELIGDDNDIVLGKSISLLLLRRV